MRDIMQMRSQCKYYGSGSYGSGCLYRPKKNHEHVGDEKHCMALLLNLLGLKSVTDFKG